MIFGATHATVAGRVIAGRRRTGRLSVRADVVGRWAPVLVIVGLIGMVLVTIGAALLLDADGAAHPVIGASVFVALLILLGGPALMAAIRPSARRLGAASLQIRRLSRLRRLPRRAARSSALL